MSFDLQRLYTMCVGKWRDVPFNLRRDFDDLKDLKGFIRSEMGIFSEILELGVNDRYVELVINNESRRDRDKVRIGYVDNRCQYIKLGRPLIEEDLSVVRVSFLCENCRENLQTIFL